MQEIQKKILLKLFDLFIKKGGKFEKGNVETINFSNEKPIIKITENSFNFDKIIIACGAFSKKLTDQMNEKNSSRYRKRISHSF